MVGRPDGTKSAKVPVRFNPNVVPFVLLDDLRKNKFGYNIFHINDETIILLLICC